MITLYHRPKSRATRFIFLLEELEAPYTVQTVTTRMRDGTGMPDAANPHTRTARCPRYPTTASWYSSPPPSRYTSRFPKNGLGPPVGAAQRGPYLSWLCYYGSVLEPAFMSKFMNVEVPRVTAGWVP